MRVLLLDFFGGDGMLDIALRAQKNGHQVKWHFRRDDRSKNFGKGLVEIIDDWRPWMRWADLVILADNTKYLREVDAWRKREGIPVIGATQAAADWELNRTLGQSIFKKAGIDVLPYREFSNYDQAISYVKKEMRRFVSKPCGDEPDKSLSYVSKSPEDLVYMLERWKKAQKLKGKFVLQDFVPGTEMAVGGWFGPGGFNEGWCENWEEKNVMAGGLGPNCFTPDSEVLTKSGWKFWPDVTMDDEICTLKNGKTVYDKPSRLIVQDYEGDLIGWESPYVDILVTPEHQMFVQDSHGRNKFWHEDASVTYKNRRFVLIGTSEDKSYAEISPDCAYKKPYKGKVYCLTVPSHVIYVRRNGKPCWIGQCGEMGTILRYVKKSKLADTVLKPLEDQLYEMDYCGYVDVNCIIDEQGNPWPLEFTMRFGWPTFNIQQALLKGDVIEWLADLSAGRDSRSLLLNKIACGVVMAMGDFPFSHLTRKEVTGVPIYGMTETLMDHIHPCELMMGQAPQEKNGTIVTAPMMVTSGDYVLLTTGIGDTIQSARLKAYSVMKKLKAPSSPFWRPDIGLRLRKQLPLVQKHGFASKMAFS